MRVCVTWVMTTLARFDPEAEKVGHRPAPFSMLHTGPTVITVDEAHA